MEEIKVNEKFEIELPNAIRENLNISPGDIAIFEYMENNTVHIYKK